MNPEQQFDLVIVGGGQAAARLVSQLRRLEDPRRVRLISAESEPPYERPPLSKGYLLGSFPRDKCYLHTAETLQKLAIDFVPGERVVAVDPQAKTVTTDRGSVTAYQTLVVAIGGSARRLPVDGADGARVLRLRTLADSDRLRGALETAGDVAVVGGGFLGLELAAAARELGHQVRVIEFADRLLARVMPPAVGDWIGALHRRHGVTIHLDTKVAAYRETPDGIVVDTDRGPFEAALVIEAAGAVIDSGFVPDAERLGNGALLVDANYRTSLPGIFAVGDAAALRDHDGRVIHDQSYQFANSSGEAVARTLAGAPEAAPQPAYFWTDQYDARLQSVGRWDDGSRWVERHPDGDALGLFALHDGAVTGVITVNMARDMGAARKLVGGAAVVSPELLADPDTPLKSLVG